MRRFLLFALVAVCIYGGSAAAQGPDESAIRAAMNAHVAAWNRGDIPAFMQSYEDSPDTTFFGSTARKGYQAIFEHYSSAYANREQMGTLSFSNLYVRLLAGSCGPVEYAVVTGKLPSAADANRRSHQRQWHLLARVAQGTRRIEDRPRPHQLKSRAPATGDAYSGSSIMRLPSCNR